MSIILGIDPSLTGTGLARIDTDDVLVVKASTITTKGKTGATLFERWNRLADIVIDTGAIGADLVVIESPSLAQKSQAGTLDRNGLYWLIVSHVLSESIGTQVIEIPPTVLKVYATGKGNASKDEVLLAVARRYPHVDVKNNNEADALVLAAIGHHILTGRGLVDLPATHTRALDKVARPGGIAA